MTISSSTFMDKCNEDTLLKKDELCADLILSIDFLEWFTYHVC